MRHASTRYAAYLALSAACTLILTSCETTSTAVATRKLPAYETPIAKANFQSVRTTAYTHTESDHIQYSDRNALGGRLQAASHGVQSAAYAARALPVSDSAGDYTPRSSGSLESYLTPRKKKVTKYVKTKRGRKKVVVTEYVRPTVGSAAADWSRWPAGTYFRLLSTGQIYKVDDYGWALSGRNTIDLYQATRADMNRWGVRREPIQVLKWGDRQDSLAILQPRQHYKHIRRMVLSLQGLDAEAAALE